MIHMTMAMSPLGGTSVTSSKRRANPPRALKILVVDDEPSIREVLDLLLTGEGHRVTTAAEAAEALEKFAADQPDVVLTDRVMPGMSGEELARELKRLSPDVPVILVTGFVPPESSKGANVVDGVVAKPFTFGSIWMAIARSLKHCA